MELLGNEVSTAATCSVLPPDNFARSKSNGEADTYLIKRRL